MLSVWYSARSEIRVVNVPAPAMSGNAMGTMCVAPPDDYFRFEDGSAQNHFQTNQKNNQRTRHGKRSHIDPKQLQNPLAHETETRSSKRPTQT